MSEKEIGYVYESSASGISVKMDFETFEKNKKNLVIGNFLTISIGNHDALLTSITGIKAFFDIDRSQENYILTVEVVGSILNEKFKAGSVLLPTPTEPVYLANDRILKEIFSKEGTLNFPVGRLSNNNDIEVFVEGNSFFGKHLAIVGSTGSGKSSTVAKILQTAIGINEAQNVNNELKNSHIVIFDIHAEYESAFSIEDEIFSLNSLNIENILLPYWLMNSEELETLFIETNENNAYNQISQFRLAVIKNKHKHNPNIENIKYDTPIYFSIDEVFNYISNINNEVINKSDNLNENPYIIDENGQKKEIVDKNDYFNKIYKFIPTSSSRADKAIKGPFNGEFDRFIIRLENKIKDKRLSFIMNTLKDDGHPYVTSDFEYLIKQFLGYINKSNITIIDLSGIPFEVLSITVSLVSRLIFDFSFYYSKLKHKEMSNNDIPFLIVCEEAHNYIPRKDNAMYNASKKSIEKIAKEGRKYGLSLMVVSQRPSEVSETIFAQCNNFVTLKLTNHNDQSYIKNLLPNNTNAIANTLSTLAVGQSLIVGESIPIPSLVKLSEPNPKPKSSNVRVHEIWNEKWKTLDVTEEISMTDVIKKWRS